MEAARNFIGGEWVAGTDAAQDVNPSNTADIVGLFPRADAKAAERAIEAASAAFPAWSVSGIQLRHDILKRVGDEILARKDELGRLLAREEGKTLGEAVGETVRAGQIFLFFAGECLRMAGEKIASVRPGIDVEATRTAWRLTIDDNPEGDGRPAGRPDHEVDVARVEAVRECVLRCGRYSRVGFDRPLAGQRPLVEQQRLRGRRTPAPLAGAEIGRRRPQVLRVGLDLETCGSNHDEPVTDPLDAGLP